MSNKSATFEESIERLEQIVRSMERGDIPLDESLKLFQEGTELVRRCEKLLTDAELYVVKITTDAAGETSQEAFSDE